MIFYQVLSGGYPFNTNTASIKKDHPKGMPDFVEESLKKLVLRMLLKEPEKRPTLKAVKLGLSQICTVFANRSLP